MIRQLFKRHRGQILIDINTQKDFFLAGGNACIGNHRRVLAHIRRVMAWAKHKNIPVISTCEVYPVRCLLSNGSTPLDMELSNGVNPDDNGSSEPGYCIEGTEGQKKIRYTLLSNRASFPADDSTDLPENIMRYYRQIVLHKRCVDPFDEPRIERLLSEVWAKEFILIGACAEGAVEATALGLLQRGKKVSVVVDAVGSHNKREAKLAFRKMKAKGARLIETKRLAGTSHLRHIGICDCESCRGKTEKTSVEIGDESL